MERQHNLDTNKPKEINRNNQRRIKPLHIKKTGAARLENVNQSPVYNNVKHLRPRKSLPNKTPDFQQKSAAESQFQRNQLLSRGKRAVVASDAQLWTKGLVPFMFNFSVIPCKCLFLSLCTICMKSMSTLTIRIIYKRGHIRMEK